MLWVGGQSRVVGWVHGFELSPRLSSPKIYRLSSGISVVLVRIYLGTFDGMGGIVTLSLWFLRTGIPDC